MTNKQLDKARKTHYTYLEKWGNTDRVVIRDGLGHFVDNVNLSSLRRAKPVKSRQADVRGRESPCPFLSDLDDRMGHYEKNTKRENSR